MFIYNSRIKNLKTNIFFMIIVSNFYSLSMRCEKQESQSQESQSKISQYKVLKQEDESSCGYHALYNAITIAKSLKNPSFKALSKSELYSRILKENKKKNITEINRYICAGCKYINRFPLTNRLAKTPGLKTSGIKLLKNLASNEK